MSSHLQVFQSLYQSFGHYPKCTKYNWYQSDLHIPFFFFGYIYIYIYIYICFLLILLCGLPGLQSPLFDRFTFFFADITRSGRLIEIKVIRLYFKISQNLLRLILLDGSWFEHILLILMVKFTFFFLIPRESHSSPSRL